MLVDKPPDFPSVGPSRLNQLAGADLASVGDGAVASQQLDDYLTRAQYQGHSIGLGVPGYSEAKSSHDQGKLDKIHLLPPKKPLFDSINVANPTTVLVSFPWRLNQSLVRFGISQSRGSLGRALTGDTIGTRD